MSAPAANDPPKLNEPVESSDGNVEPAGPRQARSGAELSKQLIGRAIPDTGRITGAALRKGLRLTTLAWVFGAFWMAAGTGLAQAKLAQYLGADDSRYGLLAAMPLFAVLLQIPGSWVVDYLGRRKVFFICNCVLHRFLYLVIGLLPWILPAPAVSSALVMILLIFISTALNNFGGQAWTNWMAALVPPRIRGKYFARRSRYGIFVAILTGMGVGLLLDLGERPFMHRLFDPVAHQAHLPVLIFLISILFVIAAILGMMDILTFCWVDEPPMPAVQENNLLQKLVQPLRDGEFMRYCVYWSGWMFAVSWTSALWWMFLFDFFERVARNHFTPWWSDYKYLAGTLIIGTAYNTGQFLGYPMWGRAVDKFGCKPVLFVSSTLQSLTWIPLAFLSPFMFPWVLATQVFGGIVGGGQDIANFNMMLQFIRKGGAGYQALGSVIFSLVGALGAVLAGQLASRLLFLHIPLFAGTGWEVDINRYSVVIGIGLVCRYVADLILLPRVVDIADMPAQHALRFVFQNMYGNLNALIFLPLRQMPSRAQRQLRQVQRLGMKIGEGIFGPDEK
jgi:MFS family permease